MKIDRREFFTTAARFGLMIPFWSLVPISRAQTGAYSGKFLVNVLADGGMDQSSWTDPRATDGTVNNYAAAGTAVVTAGAIRAAPMGNNQAFFTRFAPMMLVVNGIHSETNSHGDGVRANATGRLDMGYPNISELFASVHGQGTPMPWLNQGGFMDSAGLMPATPIPNANTLVALISPNAQSTTTNFMKQTDLDKTLAARAARTAAMQARGDIVPRANVVAEQFKAASDSRAMLTRVAQYIPAQFDNGFQSAHAGLVAAQAGITTTLQLSTGGFDGHNNLAGGYNGAQGALARLTDLVTYLWDKAATLNIADRMVVRVYTDFGRTPLNNGNGKDHWAAGATNVVMENNAPWGGRVVGATGPRHQALTINPTTGAVDPNGVTIRPRHVHASLRTYLGINTADPKFNLKVPSNEMIDFFNPAVSTGYPNL